MSVDGIFGAVRRYFQKSIENKLHVKEVIGTLDDLSTFKTLLDKAHTEIGESKITVFAPTNTAFNYAFKEVETHEKWGSALEYFASLPVESLTQLLKYHIVAEPITYDMLTDLTNGDKVDDGVEHIIDGTENGQSLAYVVHDSGEVFLLDAQNRGATQQKPRFRTGSRVLELFECLEEGFLYKVDRVLLPSESFK